MRRLWDNAAAVGGLVLIVVVIGLIAGAYLGDFGEGLMIALGCVAIVVVIGLFSITYDTVAWIASGRKGEPPWRR